MNRKVLTAREIRLLLQTEKYRQRPVREDDGTKDDPFYLKISGVLDRLPYSESGPDKVWRVWLPAPKSEKLINYSWFLFELLRYRDTVMFFLDKQAIPVLESYSDMALIGDLRAWIATELPRQAHDFLADPLAYAKKLEKNVDLNKRKGKIKRRDLWDAGYLRWGLTDDEIRAFLDALEHNDPGRVLPEFSLREYLEYCDACYRANYPQHYGFSSAEEKLIFELDDSPLEKYRKMADGRNEGLIDLPPNDSVAFDLWYTERSGIGHPWEIFRGGNSTHVDLAAYKTDGGYRVLFRGINRFDEVARSVIVLEAKGLPFVLENVDSFKAMATGDDFVGILPYWHFPRYAQGEFPAEDRIESFMNLPLEMDEIRGIKKKITWYPL